MLDSKAGLYIGDIHKLGFSLVRNMPICYNKTVNSYFSNLTKKFMPRKINPALMKPLTVSAELEAVVGKGPMPRAQVVKKLWEYIKKNNLQNEKNKRNIFADDKLMPIFGKKEVNMFEMTKLVSKHLS